MKHTRSIVAAALALAAFGGAHAVRALPPFTDASAEEPKDNFGPGFTFYEERAKKLLKVCGVKVWEAAEIAKRSGFHGHAIEEAERAIEFDPELKDAREYLCYVKDKNGKWVRDEEAWNSPGFNKQNTRTGKDGKQEPIESFEKRIEKWKEEVLFPAYKFVAQKYAELGDECAAKGHPDQAKKGWESALRLDKDNAKARKGLGYKKLGKVWLTDKQEKARVDASKGVVDKEKSSWDDFFGAKMNVVVSGHFRFVSPHPVEELMEYAKAAETAYAYYLADFGMDPTGDAFGGDRMEYVVCGPDDQWNKYVDAFASTDKEFTRQLGGTGQGPLRRCVRSKQDSNAVSRTDMIVHTTVHTLNQLVWKVYQHAWVDEGLAYYYTIKVLENTLTHCVAQKETKVYGGGSQKEGGLKTWDEVLNWKPKVKEIVLAKNDTPFRTLVKQRITELQFEATVKSWCMITWLMETDRDKFIDLLKLLETAKDGEQPVQSIYEKGLEQIDDEWRAFVRKTY
ncbi:MAG: hypothetical protein HMLKMBBP_02010 [Planctomycetes bacterium]|nr:hypothetical protein [Planctomycetota bacterium]